VLEYKALVDWLGLWAWVECPEEGLPREAAAEGVAGVAVWQGLAAYLGEKAGAVAEGGPAVGDG